MKIYIPLIINETGKWVAYGHHSHTPEESYSIASECADFNSKVEKVYYVEVDVPLPTPEKIGGEIVEA